MKIAFGCDHGGYELKEALKKTVEKLGHEVEDFGCYSLESCDYPDFGAAAAKAVAEGKCEKGIVVCTTGIGISIAANRFEGIRCALCGDCFSAQATREHNDSNILALGARVTAGGLALKIVDTWLDTPFSEGPRHKQRIAKIEEM